MSATPAWELAGQKIPVPDLKASRIGAISGVHGERKRPTVHLLQAVTQHRSVNLVQQLGVDLDHAVRADTE